MPPGREMDALVAERVMGWKRVDVPAAMRAMAAKDAVAVEHPEGGTTILEHGGSCEGMPFSCERRLPRYSTDIEAAWSAIDKLTERFGDSVNFDMEREGGRWHAAFVCHGFGVRGSTWMRGDSGPHAICRAALKAVGL